MTDVYVATSQYARGVYHEDADCRRLSSTEARPVASAHIVDNYRPCQVCADDHEQADTVRDLDCPECGTEMSANALRHHLPCSGPEAVADD